MTIDDVLAYPWVAPPKNTPAGSYLYDTLRIQDLPNTPVRVVSSSLVLLRGLLMMGDYITIISLNQIAHEYEQGVLVPLPIELADSARAIGLTYRRDWRPTKTQQQFLSYLREVSAGMNSGGGSVAPRLCGNSIAVDAIEWAIEPRRWYSPRHSVRTGRRPCRMRPLVSDPAHAALTACRFRPKQDGNDRRK